MRWRRLRVLVANLPRTSRTSCAISGVRWPQTQEVMADLWDVTVGAAWTKNTPAPTYPRPWIKPDTVGEGNGMDLDAYNEWRAKQFQPAAEEGDS